VSERSGDKEGQILAVETLRVGQGVVEQFDLEEAERRFEAHIVRGTEEYVKAWLVLEHIRDSEAWRGTLLSDGTVAQSFESYVRDLIARLRERHPSLPISRSTVFYNLRWLRRANAIGVKPDMILSAPPSVMNRLSQMAEWDHRTGEIVEVHTDIVDVDALPGYGDEKERFAELVRDVIHSEPKDAHELVRRVQRDYSDEFTYTVTTWRNRITNIRVRFTRYVDGEPVESRWYELLPVCDDVPEEVIRDFAGRLGTIPDERDILEVDIAPENAILSS